MASKNENNLRFVHLCRELEQLFADVTRKPSRNDPTAPDADLPSFPMQTPDDALKRIDVVAQQFFNAALSGMHSPNETSGWTPAVYREGVVDFWGMVDPPSCVALGTFDRLPVIEDVNKIVQKMQEAAGLAAGIIERHWAREQVDETKMPTGQPPRRSRQGANQPADELDRLAPAPPVRRPDWMDVPNGNKTEQGTPGTTSVTYGPNFDRSGLLEPTITPTGPKEMQSSAIDLTLVKTIGEVHAVDLVRVLTVSMQDIKDLAIQIHKELERIDRFVMSLSGERGLNSQSGEPLTVAQADELTTLNDSLVHASLKLQVDGPRMFAEMGVDFAAVAKAVTRNIGYAVDAMQYVAGRTLTHDEYVGLGFDVTLLGCQVLEGPFGNRVFDYIRSVLDELQDQPGRHFEDYSLVTFRDILKGANPDMDFYGRRAPDPYVSQPLQR